ncbi:MAG TPA: hypothetical protein VFZ89_10595, partial [Solirubrobacteraceae bacterium]
EVVQSFSDDALTHDPESGVPVQRVLHAPAIHDKGGDQRERQRRLHDREAERGANEHDERFRAERREKQKAQASYEAQKKQAFKTAQDRARAERKPPPKWRDD